MSWHKRILALIRDEGGAVAVTYALALGALIAIAGIAFDFARLASIDSELQNAADQAALAAATQLDQKSDAITRAEAAVNDYFANSSSPVINRTLLANDQQGSAITNVSFTFYTSYDGVNDTFGTETSDGTLAHVVKVRINARKAFYAFTPIVGAFSSGDILADAVAGLQSAFCNTPPLMVCSPSPNFPSSADVGKGILMVPGGQTGFWSPGDFGYLNFTGGGANGLRDLISTNGNNNYCQASDSTVEAQSGVVTTVTDVLNTVFDVYSPGLIGPSDCTADGAYCPAENTRKDVVRLEQWDWNTSAPPGSPPPRPACNSSLTSQGGGNPKVTVSENVSLPPTALPATSQVQGFWRDNCHKTMSCAGGKFGDGVWDVNGYIAAHPAVATAIDAGDLPNPATGGKLTRYEIYKWERDNPGSGGLDQILANPGDAVICNPVGGGNCKFTWKNYCAYPTPIHGSGANTPPRDRRVITVAAVDCPPVTNHTYYVNRWMDVFLTEPSLNRSVPYPTSQQQIYGEVIGPGTDPTGNVAFQYYGRNKVVLLR